MEQPVPGPRGTARLPLAGPWRARVLVALAWAGAAGLNQRVDGAGAAIFSLPVALAALYDGWRGGLAAALLSAGWLHISSSSPPSAPQAVEGAVLLILGLAAGAIAGRERRQKEHYAKLAGQLGSVYEKVQANFEGMKRVERLSALGQLSAGLAHEIRNPLASISGAAAILQRNPAADPKQARCLEIIAKESQRLNGLLTNFLNFARPRPPRLQTVELGTVIDSVLALAGHGIHGKTVHLEKQLTPGLPPAECDPEQLEQVLLNLMINAIEASPDGDTVTLVAAAEDQWIAIRVVDRGHGVAPSHVDRLFDPFFTTKEHGTGLGLPVAHQITRQMGGSLLAERNPGKGMTFSVILPAKYGDR